MANPFKKIENEIKKGINRLGDSVKGSINQLGGEVRHGVESVGNNVEHGIQSVGREVESGVKKVGNDAAHELEGASKRLAHEIEDIAEKTIDELEDKAKEALETIFNEISKAGFRKAVSALKKTEKISETALKDASFELGLSLIGLSWNDIGGRVGSIREKVEGFANTPPKLSRSYLLNVVKAVAPDQVSLSIDVQLAALIITSDDLAASFKLTVSLPAFLEASDELLEAVGL